MTTWQQFKSVSCLALREARAHPLLALGCVWGFMPILGYRWDTDAHRWVAR